MGRGLQKVEYPQCGVRYAGGLRLLFFFTGFRLLSLVRWLWVAAGLGRFPLVI